MAVEKVLVPMGAVGGIGELGVEAHYCGEDLGKEEDKKAREEGGGGGGGGQGGGSALDWGCE